MQCNAARRSRSLLPVSADGSCMVPSYVINKRLNKAGVHPTPTCRREPMRSVNPPGPRWPAAVQSVLFQRHRAWLLPTMARRYGDVFALRVPPYADNLVVFNRPEHIKEIFAADPHDLHAGEGNQILGPVMGEHSLLLVDEDQHARARRLLMPAFNGASLRGYRDLVTDIAKAEVDRWRAGAEVAALDR